MHGNFRGISEFKIGYANSTPGTASLELYFDHQAREMGLLMELALDNHLKKPFFLGGGGGVLPLL